MKGLYSAVLRRSWAYGCSAVCADASTGDDKMTLWAREGRFPQPGPYCSLSDYVAERLACLGLIDAVGNYEHMRNARFPVRVKDRVDGCYQHLHIYLVHLGIGRSWKNSRNVQ